MRTFSGHLLTNEPNKTSFANVFCRLGVATSSKPFRVGDNNAGAYFFGIDSKYLVQVQKKEIFDLIGHGFDYQSLMEMSIEERRYYYDLLVAKNNPKAGTEFKFKK